MHNLLRQAFEQANIWNMINFNPVINASPPPFKDYDIDTWTKDEVGQFLKWEDIDFNKQVINIRRSLACSDNGLIL